MTGTPLAALLFDFDGTLCDSETVWFRTLSRAYEDVGLPFDGDRFWATVGAPAEAFDPFEPLARTIGVATASLEVCLNSSVTAELVALGPAPGVRELIAATHDDGVRLAIVSNNTSGHIRGVLDGWQLRSFFELVVGRELGLDQKPHPAPYLHALSVLGLAPAQAVAVEDSHSGVTSATEAGVHCFASVGWGEPESDARVTTIPSVAALRYHPATGIRTL